ncbi:MAG: MerC domain-containing protein [Roseivirga sp.]|nr:MerC domain-containing protein [Roseivirga sp.]
MLREGVRPARLDGIGTVLSMGCAIHCLIFPILISLGSLATVGDSLHEVTEISFLVLTLTIGFWSFSSSFPVHRRPAPLVMVIISMLLILSARFTGIHAVETTLSVTGAVLIASAHIVNRRYLKRACR